MKNGLKINVFCYVLGMVLLAPSAQAQIIRKDLAAGRTIVVRGYEDDLLNPNKSIEGISFRLWRKAERKCGPSWNLVSFEVGSQGGSTVFTSLICEREIADRESDSESESEMLYSLGSAFEGARLSRSGMTIVRDFRIADGEKSNSSPSAGGSSHSETSAASAAK